MKFTNKDNGKEHPFIEGEDGVVDSVTSLQQEGFQLETCTVLHDGSGQAFFLVEDNGKLKWFSLRYD